jgi:hypothetical protein
VAPTDGFRVDPAFSPALVVGTLIHEWHHLVAERKRLAALQASPTGVRVADADPWLSEGLAEWATIALTSSFRGAAGSYGHLEHLKRSGLRDLDPNDPHVLGLQLVLAGQASVRGEAFRDLLVAHLDDPAALARALGFGGKAGQPLRKPATLMLIPETTFTIDGGVSDHVTQRILIPNEVVR